MRSTKKERAKRSINNRIITSLFLTLIILASLVLVNVQPASAVTLGLSFSPALQCSGRPITITATITINSSEMVPIENILLYIDSIEVADFEVNGVPNSTTNPPVASITGPGAPSYGHSDNRYGYGYGSQAGSIGDHYWNWGYGYGYGYGPITLTYTIVLNTSVMATGAHTARLRANLVSSADYFLSPVETFTIRTCGGGGGGYSPTFTTDLCGSTNYWSILNTGVIRENVSVSCTNGNFSINISAGTKLLLNGSMLSGITMESVTPLPESPDGYYVLNAFNFEPDGATFDPGFEFTINYDPDSIPEGFSEENLVIGIYDDATGTWTYLTGTVDTENNTVTFTITHFTMFALMAVAAPTPTATPTSTPTPTQTVAPTPTATVTPTAVPTIPSGGGTSGQSEMPDRWILIVLVVVGAALLGGLIGAIVIRAKK